MTKDRNDTATNDLGTITGNPPATGTEATAAAPRVRKPRKPSAKVQQMLDAERGKGYAVGIIDGKQKAKDEQGSVASHIVWLLLAFIAGMIARNWLFINQ